MILQAYYEPRFSRHSHGFRPGRSCHTVLKEIQREWTGSIWFIEGDIKGCFDNIDHSTLLEIMQRDLHDDRLFRLLRGLLKAGYMENGVKQSTHRGTPQGSILSPLLSNVYLHELDRFVVDTLIPENTRGHRRQLNLAWNRLVRRARYYRSKGDFQLAETYARRARCLPSSDPYDPAYRRLRYVRYADDFLLGFAGPRKEAELIRERLAEFLLEHLRLTLSPEKTLITHAVTEKARFLGYEVGVSRANSYLTRVERNGTKTRARATNGRIRLEMPRSVVVDLRRRFSRGNKVVHRAERLHDSDYAIIQSYQSVLRGLYNYYCLATNVGDRMSHIKWVLETSLTKTLAHKYRCRVQRIYKKYQAINSDGRKVLQVVVDRSPDKPPLVATFGGLAFVRNPDGFGRSEFSFDFAWFCRAGDRSEIVNHLLAGKCAACGAEGPVQMHHIRKLADLKKFSRQKWAEIMSARKRKFLPLCATCHRQVHNGDYDGPNLKRLLESVVR